MATLPRSLPAKPRVIWEQKLAGPGLGGIAATADYVVLGDRDLGNVQDVFRAYDAATGIPLWTVRYPAAGQLDYGNTPRATPLVDGDRVYLLGAFGDLHCVRLATGELLWRKNLRDEFGVRTRLIWGTCSSPLLVDGKLIVNPGAPDASLVALDPVTGKRLWQTPGGAAAYGSLIAGRFGGVLQIVGHDRETLGGWDARNGKRLWTLKPPLAGDFNVPTPVRVGEQLVVTSENNGTRLYRFQPGGRIDPQPVALNEDLAPDMSTPVVLGHRLFCVWGGLFCLDVQQGLKQLWLGDDDAFSDYAAVIGGGDRLLVIGVGGRLVLVDAASDPFRVVSRLRVFNDGEYEVYAHPALVGTRLFLRGESALACVDLSP